MRRVLIIILLLIFLGCSARYSKFSYGGVKIKPDPNKEYEYQEYISIYGVIKDVYDEDSSLSHIIVAPIRDYLMIDGEVYIPKSVKILNDEIKLIYKGKKYFLPVTREEENRRNNTEAIRYDSFIPTGGQVIKLDGSGLNIIIEDFDLSIGKVEIDGTKVVDVPLLRFKKNIKVTKFNPFLGGLNIDTKKTIYLGPLEDYKKKK